VPDILVTISDPVADLRQYLLEDPSVQLLSGGRIFAGELPDDENQYMPRQCAIVSPAGGFDLASYVQTTTMRFDVRTYGETYQQAFALRQLINQRLKQTKRVSVNNTLFHYFQLVSGPSQMREQDYQWTLSFDSYLALVAEVPVP
jgi:hypothetical protein